MAHVQHICFKRHQLLPNLLSFPLSLLAHFLNLQSLYTQATTSVLCSHYIHRCEPAPNTQPPCAGPVDKASASKVIFTLLFWAPKQGSGRISSSHNSSKIAEAAHKAHCVIIVPSANILKAWFYNPLNFSATRTSSLRPN